MPASGRWPSELLATLFEDGLVTIPNPLLQYYTRLGLLEIEVMVIIHLLRCRQIEHDRFPSPEKLSQYISIDSEEVKNVLAGLMEKQLVTVEPYYNPDTGRWFNAFSLRNLWHRLVEVMAAEGGGLNPRDSDSLPPEDRPAVSETGLGAIYRTFEKEFGRPLSPFESSQIADWYQNPDLKPELIIEALKRAVLRGALNFRYIDSILKDWLRHNIRTVQEAVAYDERLFKQRPGRKRRTELPAEDKYRELYRLEPGK